MGRRRIAAGFMVAVAVAAAVVVTVANRGSGTPKRDSVAAYIRDVDSIQQQMRPQLLEAMRAYRAFSSGRPISSKLLAQLRDARDTLVALRLRLVSLPPPPAVIRLRGLLIAVVGAEVGTAQEVVDLAEFAPAYTRVLENSRVASAQLSHALAAVKVPNPRTLRGTREQVRVAQAEFDAAAARAAAAQADAVDTYLARIAVVRQELRRLHPPPLMHPDWRAQLRTLDRSRAAGAALAAELRRPKRTRVAVLARNLTIAARTAGTLPAQTEQAAAITAYNRRVKAIESIAARVQRELTQLQKLAT